MKTVTKAELKRMATDKQFDRLMRLKNARVAAALGIPTALKYVLDVLIEEREDALH